MIASLINCVPFLEYYFGYNRGETRVKSANFLMLHIYSKRQKFKKTKHIGKDMEELEVPKSSGKTTTGNNHLRLQYVLICSVVAGSLQRYRL